jgi:plastin-1
MHSLTEEETNAYAEITNYLLKGDASLSHVVPVHPTSNLYKNIGDGLILWYCHQTSFSLHSKLINKAAPGTIDERAINQKQPLNKFQIIENLNLAIHSAASIGCVTTGVVPQLIVEQKEYLILALVWQVVRAWATRQIDLKQHPALIRLLHEGEELSSFLKLPPEEILLRWFNYHLANAKHPRKVTNFSSDVKVISLIQANSLLRMVRTTLCC